MELQTEDVTAYVNRLDMEQNERLQEDENEVVRLWKAKHTLLSALDPSKPSLSSPIEENSSVYDTELLDDGDETNSIISQQTDCPKVTLKPSM